MMLFLKRLYEFLVQAQVSIARFFTGLPFWKDVERICLIVAGPVRGVASLALRLFPFLRRFEKYLEVESLRTRSPVILAFSITLLAFRGILTSPNGHIGTDLSVFPLLTLISCFNPFLGGLSGLVFGAADLVQKLAKPDIYGAMTWSHPNYMGALVGYIAAYSITVWMGVMPGLVSRIGRDFAISFFRKIWANRATAHADGATPLPFYSWTGAAGLLGSMVGAMVTAFTGVRFVAPILEWPAFHWRPSPDVSCYKAELATLQASASRSAVMGIVGGGVVATTPPADSPPPIPVGVTPPPIPGAPPPIPSVPPPPGAPVTHRDGDTNELGEVWSSFSGGYVGRKTYDQDMASRTWIANKNEADLHSGQSEDVKKAYDKWLESRDRLSDIQAEGRKLDIEIKKLEVSMLERESARGVSASETMDAFLRGSLTTLESAAGIVPDLFNPEILKGTATNIAGEMIASGARARAAGIGTNLMAAGGAVLHSVKGMAEGVATIAKVGWHVVADIPGSIATAGNIVSAVKADPLESLEILTRAVEKTTAPIVDGSKPLGERLEGPTKLLLDVATGEALGLGVGRALNAAAKLKPVQSVINKIGEIKSGIFGEEAVKTGQRVWGTGQKVGAEAERAALAKVPPDHPLRKIGDINEAAAKAGPEFNSRLVKGDRRLNIKDPAYEKGMQALKTEPKYLTPEAREMADAVRYDQHLRAQERALKDMYIDHPELRGHVKGIENTGSHAKKGLDYKTVSDVDSNALGDGTELGRKAEEAYVKYYRQAIEKNSEAISNGRCKLTADDLNSNVYGDGTAKGALKSATGDDFVRSYRATGKGRFDVYDNDGNFSHSLDGNDPLLGGNRKFFDRSNPAEAAGRAKDFGRDVANKHFEEVGGMDPDNRLRQALKNTKTIGNVNGKLTGQKLPEHIAKIVKNPTALGKEHAIATLEDFLRSQ